MNHRAFQIVKHLTSPILPRSSLKAEDTGFAQKIKDAHLEEVLDYDIIVSPIPAFNAKTPDVTSLKIEDRFLGVKA
ncbi:MAG TPA: hypothetical protein GXZ81_00590 [Fastidiosipila sp.]|nr:hypothetical protein [Fastidiosipila sp.]